MTENINVEVLIDIGLICAVILFILEHPYITIAFGLLLATSVLVRICSDGEISNA